MKNSTKIVLSILGILVVGLISLIIFRAYHAPITTDGQNLGAGDVRNPGETFPNGVSFGKPQSIDVNWAADKIPAKSNFAFWKNTTGQKVWVDYAEISTDGTASSTYKIFGFATSTAYNAALYDFTAPAMNATTWIAISSFQFATSSAATTTTNIDRAAAGKTVPVANGSYFIFNLMNVDSGCASQSSGVCETATSSKRGFNLPWRIRYHN